VKVSVAERKKRGAEVMWSPTGKPVAQVEGLIGRERESGGYIPQLTRDIRQRLGVNGIERKWVTPSVKRFVPEKRHR
jgi:hypothetical protein